MVATAIGAMATTHYRLYIGAGLVTLIFLAYVIPLYFRDPILAFLALWVFEVVNAPISAVFGYFSTTGQSIRQGDEVLVLVFLLLTAVRTLNTSAELPPLRYLLPGLAVAIFGILSSIVHTVPLSIASVGALLGLKFWLMVGASLFLPWRRSDTERVFSTLIVIGLVVALLGVADYFTHGLVSRTLHTSNYNGGGNGYRAEAVHSIFPTPGEYSLFMSLLFAVTLSRFTVRLRSQELLLALLFAGSVILSLRLKGVLSLLAVVAIVGLVQSTVNSNRAILGFCIGALVFVGVYMIEGSVISQQVTTYTSTETSARSRLYSTGTKIADDNFPLGVGFGRFASYPSRLHYSPVYYQYGLSTVWGLSPTYRSFIDDTSWPSVVGETGYGGTLAFVIGLLMLVWAAIRRLRSDKRDWLPLAALCALTVLVVDSLGDPSLFSWLATTTVAMIVGPMLRAEIREGVSQESLQATDAPIASSPLVLAPR